MGSLSRCTPMFLCDLGVVSSLDKSIDFHTSQSGPSTFWILYVNCQVCNCARGCQYIGARDWASQIGACILLSGSQHAQMSRNRLAPTCRLSRNTGVMGARRSLSGSLIMVQSYCNHSRCADNRQPSQENIDQVGLRTTSSRGISHSPV